MVYKACKNWCIAAPQEADAPGVTVQTPFAPLVLLHPWDPLTSRGVYAIDSLSQMGQESVETLLPGAVQAGALSDFVACHGATVLNPAFPGAWEYLQSLEAAPRHGLRLTLVGLGDVGAAVLTGLKLLGHELRQIRIFDPNEALCRRYALELNQILSPDERDLPEVVVCPPEQLFDCDLFLFAATRGIPSPKTGKDVRMAQFEANRAMLKGYARRARASRFKGLFCIISDPVDHLCRSVFLESNRDERGKADFMGLLPEQLQGFGLGVMAARARYAARERGLPTEKVRVYGPHGAGLVVANAPGRNYDPGLSQLLTEATRTMNLRIRDLGFKPYIAPGLSSAAVSVLRLIRGQRHYGAIPLGGAYFGCESWMTPRGIRIFRENLHPALLDRISDAHRQLQTFPYDT